MGVHLIKQQTSIKKKEFLFLLVNDFFYFHTNIKNCIFYVYKLVHTYWQAIYVCVCVCKEATLICNMLNFQTIYLSHDVSNDSIYLTDTFIWNLIYI